VLLFETMEEVKRFLEGLERATPNGYKPFVKAEMDHGWMKPAVRVWGTSELHIEAALLWGRVKALALLE